MDSEFHSRECEMINNSIINRPHFYLKKNEVVSGPFGSTLRSDSYLDEGVPFIRIENIKGGFSIDKNEMIYISPEDNRRLSNSQLFLDDLILSKVGHSIGYFARIDDTIVSCNISENNIGIKLRNYDVATKHFILTYLNTDLAKKLVLRRKSGNAQPKLNVNDITFIPIPILTSSFKEAISNIVVKSSLTQKKAIDLYNKSEIDLLQHFNMNFNNNRFPIGYTSTLGSVKKTGRLDAEYYQPQFEYLYNEIRKKQTKQLKNIVSIQKSIEPGSDYYLEDGVPFVRVADITKFGISVPSIYLDNDTFADVIRPKKDTILLSKDGSIGIAYKIEKDEDFITSGAILHLHVDDKSVLPDYLTLVINSKVVQMQAERDAGGSIIQHWKPSEISTVIIPILPMEEQLEISNKVQESFMLRRESKRLLDIAKQAVEIAISENEETALNFLKDNG